MGAAQETLETIGEGLTGRKRASDERGCTLSRLLERVAAGIARPTRLRRGSSVDKLLRRHRNKGSGPVNRRVGTRAVAGVVRQCGDSGAEHGASAYFGHYDFRQRCLS